MTTVIGPARLSCQPISNLTHYHKLAANFLARGSTRLVTNTAEMRPTSKNLNPAASAGIQTARFCTQPQLTGEPLRALTVVAKSRRRSWNGIRPIYRFGRQRGGRVLSRQSRFQVDKHNPGKFAALLSDDLTLYLSAPGAGSGGQAGGDPKPGGWDRFMIVTKELDS